MSGAEETIDEFLKYLKSKGFDVTSINCNEKYLMYNDKYDDIINEKISNIYDGFNKHFFSCYDNFFIKAEKIIREVKPDIILCQLNGLEELVSISKQFKIPIIYFIHSYSNKNMNISNNKYINLLYKEVDGIVCLSKFIKNSLPDCLENKIDVVYPYIQPEKFKCDKINPKNILFFNPIYTKGIDIIIELAKIFPKEIFEIYETWGRINKRLKNKIEILPNIQIKKNTLNSKILYSNAKIFLMPSQCDEGFGRGIVEANVNGIPIIASNVGGINEATGKNQMLINQYNNIDFWVDALRKLLEDRNFYNNMKVNAIENGKKFNKCNIEYIILKYI